MTDDRPVVGRVSFSHNTTIPHEDLIPLPTVRNKLRDNELRGILRRCREAVRGGKAIKFAGLCDVISP
jgi:hypothetical protein